jgi:5-methyltetrahydropteroyltriglutamate--homocysteine methyltransferase
MTEKIETTVVCSYPVSAWLAGAPSEQALADATRVVLHTQEQAGIDLVWNGKINALVAGRDIYEGR